MPTVFRDSGFRCFFYSNEGNPREHVHVTKGSGEAKLWLRPNVSIASNEGFSAKALRELLTMIEENREKIERAWNEFFG